MKVLKISIISEKRKMKTGINTNVERIFSLKEEY